MRFMAKFEAKSIISGKPLQEVNLNSFSFLNFSSVNLFNSNLIFIDHRKLQNVPYKVLGSINLTCLVITFEK